MRLIDYFDNSATSHPSKVAFVQPDGSSLTYAQAQQQSLRIASAIEGAGISRDGKIAVYSPNDARAFIAMLGIFRCGRVWVPLNARNTVEDNSAFMNYTDVECIFYHSTFEAEIRQLKASAPQLKLMICLDDRSGPGPSLSEFCDGATAAIPDLPDDPLRPCNILATGGTTGRSKGAVWTNQTWETLIANFWTCNDATGPAPVHLCVAPMTHGAGVLALMLMPMAPTNVILDKVDPAVILDAIEKHGVTHLYLPPTVLYALLSSPELRTKKLSSLRFFLISAAPVAPERLRTAVEVFGPVMAQAFGQAEAPFFLTFLSPDDHKRGLAAGSDLLRSCGRPTMFSRVEIMDEHGSLLAPRSVGEIVARGCLVMKEYYKDPEATRAVSGFGWHHTGDIGFKDEDGYVYIVDRKRDMIISGGFNVFSTEVEARLLAHQSVQDCAVIGIPDEKWGEAVTAVVELKAGASATADELIAFCRATLGGVKTPKAIEIWPTLPRSPVGKVLKRAIRDRYWEGRSRAV
ncbi:AMP-binding protein [Bradyrhizobium sp. Ash2021]|uniref:class I adenylate-forming enzyme family protein n=1 Tax=Bradyrhizobium sp. Ash2021 TaxID=2954771 RepID=UPI002814BF00|nr:AMP-binding protein [Bradyrhizobium sp. Ash2021]WMT73472.1 AMP-binding protein [Bradyrhizobium sp. Ash2021]